jgi:hypothetical protein
LKKTPFRLDFPGLQRRHRKDGSTALYWMPYADAIAAGFRPKTVRLHYPDNSPELAKRCEDLRAQMVAWRANPDKADKRVEFDGTIASYIKIYETDPDSPYQDLDETTQRSYRIRLRRLYKTVGDRRVDRLNGIDFRRWYKRFRKPKREGDPEHVTGAHDLMKMLRTVISFAVESGLPHATRLRDALSEIRFQNGRPRSQHVTYEQAAAFIAKAHELGHPEMALAQALAFELTLRQTDVIGKWRRIKSEPNAWEWVNGLVWQEVGGDGILVHLTSKNGQEVVYDLTVYPLIVAELDRLPDMLRIGAVVIDSATGQPFKYNEFRKRWRQIARRASIPDDIWNRDSRAGGLTEGGDAGAEIVDLAQHAGHTDMRTTQRYNRRTVAKTRRVQELRVEHRTNHELAHSNAGSNVIKRHIE